LSDYEIIVVDDGSEDDTQKTLRPFFGDIVYIHQKNSGGPSAPRNVGIERARGKYISFLDSDDVLSPDKLKHAVDFLEEVPAVGLVFSDFVKRAEDGTPHPESFLAQCERFKGLEKIKVGENRFLIHKDVAFDAMLLENFVGTSSVVCRKTVLSHVGRFDESVTSVEDRDMWLRIARDYDIGYYDAVDHVYTDRISSVSKNGLIASLCRVKILERYVADARSRATRREAKRAIARCCCDAGYGYVLSGDIRAARRSYLKGLLKGNIMASGKGLLRTTLIGRGLAAARKRKKVSAST
jgi:glycosyltransferase involved in cell wall biosynthesis